jgi:hypothetical protein
LIQKFDLKGIIIKCQSYTKAKVQRISEMEFFSLGKKILRGALLSRTLFFRNGSGQKAGARAQQKKPVENARKMRIFAAFFRK